MSDDGKSEGQEKSHLPTPQKIRRAREQGDVVYSSEVTTAATYAAFFIVLIVAGAWSAAKVGEVLQRFFRRPDDIAAALAATGGQPFVAGLAGELLSAMSPLFGGLALAAVCSIAAQRAVAFAPSKIKPKLSRLSIIANAKKKYGPDGLFEFLKSFAKLSAIIIILILALKDRFLGLPALSAYPVHGVAQILQREAVFFTGLVTIAAAAIAAADFPWRRAQHTKRLMMTFEELKKESKETEGDPALKQARRERGTAIARNRMLAEVPNSNVVIVNPTHYAVALRWSREEGGAPLVVAKGVDEVAARIRETAARAGVPIRRDPPTARSIYALVDIGEEIEREHYAAVAAAIHYAEEIRRKARKERP